MGNCDKKFSSLQTLVTGTDGKVEEVKSKLAEYRAAIAAAKATVTKAQAELKDLVDTKQEAILVMLGTLE